MNAVIVLTTVGAAFDVAALARTLVDEHLAACVNVLPPMQSIYRWQGQVHVDDERQLVIKTSAGPASRRCSSACALCIPTTCPSFWWSRSPGGSQAYLDWLGAVRPRPRLT